MKTSTHRQRRERDLKAEDPLQILNGLSWLAKWRVLKLSWDLGLSLEETKKQIGDRTINLKKTRMLKGSGKRLEIEAWAGAICPRCGQRLPFKKE